MSGLGEDPLGGRAMLKLRLMWSAVLLLWAGSAARADLNGAQVLSKCEQAYAALTSYTGTTTVSSKAQFGARSLDQTATARITFASPGKIYIAGKDTGGHAFTIISNGAATWSAWELRNNGEFE